MYSFLVSYDILKFQKLSLSGSFQNNWSLNREICLKINIVANQLSAKLQDADGEKIYCRRVYVENLFLQNEAK